MSRWRTVYDEILWSRKEPAAFSIAVARREEKTSTLRNTLVRNGSLLSHPEIAFSSDFFKVSTAFKGLIVA